MFFISIVMTLPPPAKDASWSHRKRQLIDQMSHLFESGEKTWEIAFKSDFIVYFTVLSIGEPFPSSIMHFLFIMSWSNIGPTAKGWFRCRDIRLIWEIDVDIFNNLVRFDMGCIDYWVYKRCIDNWGRIFPGIEALRGISARCSTIVPNCTTCFMLHYLSRTIYTNPPTGWIAQ